MSTRRPSFPTYVADWLGSTAVRLLAPEIRGVLADLKCLAHDGNPYGTITHASGRELTDVEIASVTRTDYELIRRGISVLLDARLLGRSRGSGKLFVADMVHREEVRQRRASGGVKSLDNPNVPRPKQTDFMDTLDGSPSRTSIDEKKRSVVSTSVVVVSRRESPEREPYTPEFESAWTDYPKRAGTNSKIDAWKQWQARLNALDETESVTREIASMTAGVQRYALFCTVTEKLGTETVMAAERFFGKSKHYLNPYDPPPPKKPPPAAQMFGNSQEALRDL